MRRTLLAALCFAAAAPGAVMAQTPSPDPGALESALQRLESAWRARDVAAWLALWDFSTVDAHEEERQYAQEAFDSDETQLLLERPNALDPNRGGYALNLDVFWVKEPRGRVDEWVLSLAHRKNGWRVVSKQLAGQFDGLVHLSLDPQGFKAAGMTLRLEDFELNMTAGTLFLSPESLGPTLLVFVGDGEVRFRPRPEEEQEQLRQFASTTELRERVAQALVRIHPADLHHVLESLRLEPDPDAARRLPMAQRLFREQGSRSFVLDVAAPRSPWWLLPSQGDASVSFETRSKGMLTFTVSSGEAEGISLFDRERKQQICLYPRAGADTRYSEEQGRSVDILDHDLRVRVDPVRELIEGEDTIRIKLLASLTALRLKLDDAFKVESVTSQAGRHLFFRVRNQDSLMVSLGSLSGTLGEISLTVRYSGVLHPGTIESEVLQAAGPTSEVEIPIEGVLTYSNRSAWYPQGVNDDYATARVRFDLPIGYTAVTGGVRKEARVIGDRVVWEYLQEQPGRYITAVVGRLQEAGHSSEAGIPIKAYAVARLRGEAPATLKAAAEILKFYATQFGPLPYSSLNLVLTEGPTPGGHSPPGMVLIQVRPSLLRSSLRDDPANFTDVPGFFLAHELAHQWWGHGVAGQNYRERWISEGAAQYAAALWVQKFRGDETFQSVLRQFSRWAFRHNQMGPIQLGYRLGRIKGDPQIFRAIVYDKAAYTLHMLRNIVGPEAFRVALTRLQSERRFSKIGSDDLRDALEAVSGKDLRPYFEEWIRGTRLPALRVSQKAVAGRLSVEVSAKDLPGPVPLEIALTTSSGRHAERVTLPPHGATFNFDAAPDTKLEVNSDRALLATIVKG
jgi:hypothetical protein